MIKERSAVPPLISLRVAYSRQATQLMRGKEKSRAASTAGDSDLTEEQVVSAIALLGERGGSTLKSISRALKQNTQDVNQTNIKQVLNKAVQNGNVGRHPNKRYIFQMKLRPLQRICKKKRRKPKCKRRNRRSTRNCRCRCECRCRKYACKKGEKIIGGCRRKRCRRVCKRKRRY